MNSARALGKCLRNMISICESGQTHRSAPTKTPLCRSNPMWLPPVRMVAPVEYSLQKHLLDAREKHSCHGYGQSAGIMGGIAVQLSGGKR